MIDFTVPPELDAVRVRFARFVQDEVLPAEARAMDDAGRVVWKEVEALREKARAAGLWAPHMPTAWGGLGLGAIGMGLVSQELGASPLASLAVNCSAPDEGNMHALLAFGTPHQQERFLRPLVEGRTRSCFAMTEKGAGADPTALLTTRARLDGDAWLIDGEKIWITGAIGAAFAVVVAVTEPDAAPHERHSFLLVPTDTPGWEVVRDIPVMGTHAPGGHCEIRLTNARVPKENLLGARGRGFAQAQERLGHGRVGHAMRWIGMAQRALDLAAARALERETFGKPLAHRQAVQWMLAESAMDLYTSRLMALHTAWKVEHGLDHRQDVAMLKVYVANALHRVVDRAIQVWGGLGYSGDLPLERFYRDARAARIYDGPDEVHMISIAKRVLKASATEGTTRRAAGGIA